jgi:hypothetical protein
MADTLTRLENWLSEPGIQTGARSVKHIEYDCNWRAPFSVTLREYLADGVAHYRGEGPNAPGGLEKALISALDKAQEHKS